MTSDHYTSQYLPVNFNFYVEDDLSFEESLSEDIRSKVDAVWKAAMQDSNKILFNGKILTLLRVEENALVGKFTEYKYFYAKKQLPELAEDRRLAIVGISGITYSENKILLGQRSSFVNHFPLHYDFCPSGCIDPSVAYEGTLDLQEMLKVELEEETFIPREALERMVPFILLRNSSTGAAEVVFKLFLKQGFGTPTLAPTKEYERLFWIDESQLIPFSANNITVPTFSFFCESLRK